VGISVVLVVIMFMPTKYERIVSVGTDNFEAHQPIYGEREINFFLQSNEPVLGIGMVVVDLRHSGLLSPVEVKLGADFEVAAVSIAPDQIKDDQFAVVFFDQAIDASEDVVVTISAPEADNVNALGIRYDTILGDPALLIIERVPVYRYLSLWAAVHPERFERLIWVGAGAVALISLMLWSNVVGKVWWRDPFIWSLAALVVWTIWLRLEVALKIESAFGGDAFNYLLQSKAWLSGDNPFGLEWRRKAPLLALLLMPAYWPGIDPLFWSRVVNIGLAAMTVVLVVLLLGRLGVPRPLAIGGGALLAVNRLYWFETVHGLANPLHGFLIVAAVLALTFYRRRVGRWWVAVAASLATLARWEALLVVGVLVSSVWGLSDKRRSTLRHMLVPVILLLLLPLVMWPVTGEIGFRPPSDLVADEGLYLVYSAEDFNSNWQKFKLFFGRLWLLIPLVGHPFRWLVAGFGIGLMISVGRIKQTRVMQIAASVGLLLLIGLIFYVLVQGSQELDKLN